MEGQTPVGGDRALERQARELVPECHRPALGAHDSRCEDLFQGAELARRERLEQDEIGLPRDDRHGFEQAARIGG